MSKTSITNATNDAQNRTAPASPPAAVRGVGATVIGLSALAVVAAFIASLTLGQFAISPQQLLEVLGRGLGLANLWGQAAPGAGGADVGGTAQLAGAADAVIFNIRLPRTLLALTVGAGLGLAGTVLQGVFRHPLAEPGVLGISAGAVVGAAVASALGFATYGTLVGALASGTLTAALVWFFAKRNPEQEVLSLVLLGVAANALALAVTALLVFLIDPAGRDRVFAWQLGSLVAAKWEQVLVSAIVLLVCLVLALVLAPRLDVLALGEQTAAALGASVPRVRVGGILLATVLTAVAVAFAGVVAFVGLVIPNIMRRLLGPAHRRLAWASILVGALFVLLADLVARLAVPMAELPLGVVTGIVGGVVLFALLVKILDSGRSVK